MFYICMSMLFLSAVCENISPIYFVCEYICSTGV